MKKVFVRFTIPDLAKMGVAREVLCDVPDAMDEERFRNVVALAWIRLRHLDAEKPEEYAEAFFGELKALGVECSEAEVWEGKYELPEGYAFRYLGK